MALTAAPKEILYGIQSIAKSALGSAVRDRTSDDAGSSGRSKRKNTTIDLSFQKGVWGDGRFTSKDAYHRLNIRADVLGNAWSFEKYDAKGSSYVIFHTIGRYIDLLI